MERGSDVWLCRGAGHNESGHEYWTTITMPDWRGRPQSKSSPRRHLSVPAAFSSRCTLFVKMHALTIAIGFCFILFIGIMVFDTLYSDEPRIQTLRKATEQLGSMPPLDLTFPQEPTPPFDLPVPLSIENNLSVEAIASQIVDAEARAEERRVLYPCTTLCIIGYHHDKDCNCVPAQITSTGGVSAHPTYQPLKMKK
jgi:hypothetical protein